MSNCNCDSKSCQDAADSCDSKCSGSVSGPEGGSASCPSCGSCVRTCNCAQVVAGIAVTMTQWLDSNLLHNLTMNQLKITGHRRREGKELTEADSFTVEETIRNLAPGNGPISLTTRLKNITPGFWNITASRMDGQKLSSWSGDISAPGIIVVSNNLRTQLGAARFTSQSTPGIIRTGWSFFVGLGAVVGLTFQALAMVNRHIDVWPILLLSCLSSAFGFLTAKAWFVVQFKKPWSSYIKSGVCIQGFLVGMSVAAAGSLLLTGKSVADYFDATTPALFLAMSVGRLGCFFAGCCAGRPTTSRWGVWSSDGKLGTRRIPTQIMESLTCLVIGLASFILLNLITIPGVVFINGWVTYTMVRRGLLLPLRIENVKPIDALEQDVHRAV